MPSTQGSKWVSSRAGLFQCPSSEPWGSEVGLTRGRLSEQGLKPSLPLSRGSPEKISVSGALLLGRFWKPVLSGLRGYQSTVASLQKALNVKSIATGCVSPPVSGGFFLVVLANSQDSPFPFKIKIYIYLPGGWVSARTQDLHCILQGLLLCRADSAVVARGLRSAWASVGAAHKLSFSMVCGLFFPPTREGIRIPCIARGPPGQSLISSFSERWLNGGIPQALASRLYFLWEQRLASPQGSLMELHRLQSTVG